MNVNYILDIPFGTHNPSIDQPDMLINTNAVNTILGVDHVNFKSDNGGTHKQVTFSSKNSPNTQTDPVSVLFTQSGVASTVSNLAYANQNSGVGSPAPNPFIISLVRAWALCDATGIVALQGFNVAVVRLSAGVYRATLVVNAVNTANFSVFVSVPSIGNVAPISNITYAIAGTGPWIVTFNFTNSSSTPTDPATFSFFVMQV